MSIYLGAGSTAHKMSKLYVGVSGQTRQVQKVYVGVGGQARLVYQSGQPIGGLAVGSIVKIKVNGAAKDFIVVQQGNPDTSTYDSSCNGTWLLMKHIYTTMKWDDSNNDYLNSDMTAYLNDTFISLIDADIRNAIKRVKIPYIEYSGNNVMSGSIGLNCKVFLLSGTEVGFSGVSYMNTEGAKLSYFGSASKRVAYNGSSAAEWWLRSPDTYYIDLVWTVKSDGSSVGRYCRKTYGIRPALILPSTTLVDESGNVIG